MHHLPPGHDRAPIASSTFSALSPCLEREKAHYSTINGADVDIRVVSKYKGGEVLVESEGESEGGHVPRVGGQHKRQPPRAAAAKLVPVVSRHRRPQGGQGKAELEGPVTGD